ncbi:MAG: hypothetical protein ACRDDJ_20490 [[Mycobacterium] stephanolepidis]
MKDLRERDLSGKNGWLGELVTVAPVEYPAPFLVIERVDLAEWGFP